MPALQETRAVLTLKPGAPADVAELGAPVESGTVVKKGRVHEFLQPLADGKIGRRFQDLRVIGVRTVEAGVASAKLFLQFETFGDNTAMPTGGGAFTLTGFAGDQALGAASSGLLYLPYANVWYPNRFVFEVPLADFDAADRLEFVAMAEEVRSV